MTAGPLGFEFRQRFGNRQFVPVVTDIQQTATVPARNQNLFDTVGGTTIGRDTALEGDIGRWHDAYRRNGGFGQKNRVDSEALV